MKLFCRFKENKGDRGAILFIVAASLVVLIGFLGLAFDLGHMYVNKSQLQNMADALALAGAAVLDGTSAGIDLAADRASDVGGHLNNKTEFNSSNLTVAINRETDVTFAESLNGSYYTRAAVPNPSTIKFVRVIIPPQPTEIVFAKIVPGIPASSSFGAEATAGQKKTNEPCEGLDPFSPARIDIPPVGSGPVDPTGNFGYVVGQIYSIRLAPGNSGKNCSDYGLPGDVTGNFGFANPDPPGNGTRVFEDLLLNGYSGKCNGVGSTMPSIPGGGGSARLRAMQQRFQQDVPDQTTYTDYSSCGIPNQFCIPSNGPSNNYHGNGRRFIRVAFNDGDIPAGHHDYNIVGFGCFFMAAEPDASPPSSAICLTYVGSCNAATGAPVPNGGGASLTQLVLFR
jgi:Flp pilus assembly protein TadG